jgi:hypothetical protein
MQSKPPKGLDVIACPLVAGTCTAPMKPRERPAGHPRCQGDSKSLQGVLDENAYLRLTGRLKELINRGGEKISPLEADEVLMNHPAVAQAVAFVRAIPKGSTGKLQRIGLAAKLRLTEPSP